MSFKDFQAKHYQKYRNLFPFMKETQLKVKMKQIWERSKRRNVSLPRAREEHEQYRCCPAKYLHGM